MKSKTTFLLIALTFALTACSGGASTPPPEPGNVPPLGAGLPPKVLALIDSSYATTPELKAAAVKMATSWEAELLSASQGNAYNAALALTTLNSMMCFQTRAERINGSFTDEELASIKAAMTGSRERFLAYQKLNELSDGHAIEVLMTEASACPAVGVAP